MKKYTWTDGSIYYDELPGVMDNTSPVTEAWWIAHGGTSETVPDPPSPSTTVTWGGISGTLSNQTDLANALSAKQDVIDASHKLDYGLISNTPTIGSGALTISVGGSAVVFNANQTSDSTVEIPGGMSAVSWGEISGALANQTDLSAALASKADTTAIGSGTLTFTSGGATVATFNANQTTDTTVPLPEGGSGGAQLNYATYLAGTTGSAYLGAAGVSSGGYYITSNLTALNWDAWETIPYAKSESPSIEDFDNFDEVYLYEGRLYFLAPSADKTKVSVIGHSTPDANGYYTQYENDKYRHIRNNNEFRIIKDSDGWALYAMGPDELYVNEGNQISTAETPDADGISKWRYGAAGTDDFYVTNLEMVSEPFLGDEYTYANYNRYFKQWDWHNLYVAICNKLNYWGRKNALVHPFDQSMHNIANAKEVYGSACVADFKQTYVWTPFGDGVLSLDVDSDGRPASLPSMQPVTSGGSMVWEHAFTGRRNMYITLGASNTVSATNITIVGALLQNTTNICDLLWDGNHAYLLVLTGIGESNAIDTIELNGSALAITSKTVDITALTGITLNGSASGVTITSGIADLTVTGGGGEVNVIDSIYYGESSAAVTNKAAQLSGIIPIPTVGSANLIFTSGGTQLTSFNANATTDVTVALPEGGASPAITVIPAATTAYTLSEGQFTHIPESAPTYTLPNVTDNTHAHECTLDVKFDNVQTIVFHDYAGNLVTPQDQIDIQQGDLWRFLCQWNTVLTCWCIMPMKLTDNTVYAPVLSISPSTYAVSGNQGSTLDDLDLSSNVTVQHPVTGVSPVFSSLNLPAGVTITSAGVISGTPTAQGVTSSTVSIAYTGATSITCTIVFTIAAPPVTYYYTVSGATATPAANGDYYVHSGTQGSSGVVYTNGTFYMFDANDCWVINNAPEWDPEGLGPLFGSILHSDEGSYATVPTGTWTNGMDMPTDEATVSAYNA